MFKGIQGSIMKIDDVTRGMKVYVPNCYSPHEYKLGIVMGIRSIRVNDRWMRYVVLKMRDKNKHYYITSRWARVLREQNYG